MSAEPCLGVLFLLPADEGAIYPEIDTRTERTCLTREKDGGGSPWPSVGPDKKTTVRLVAISRCQVSSGRASAGVTLAMPAQLIATSTDPSSVTLVSRALWRSAALVTSPVSRTACRPNP